MSKYLRYSGKVAKSINKKVVKVKVKVLVKDVSGSFKFTDIMLQGNNNLTGYLINTKEMIKRNANPVKHYNVLCRGNSNAVIINNDGNTTTGLDFSVKCKNGTTGPIKVETLYRTRKIELKDNLNVGEEIHVDSFNYKVSKGAALTKNYIGSFLGIPAGFGMYNIGMSNRDMGRFVFYIKEYDRWHKT